MNASKCRRRRWQVLQAAAVAAAIMPHFAAATDRYWVAGSSDWNTAINWNTMPGGGGLSGVPVAGDNAHVFVTGSGPISVNHDGNYPAMAGINQLDLDSTGTAVLTMNQSANTMAASVEVIGLNGRGTYNQSGGANAAGTLNLGFNVGSTGTYALSGAGNMTLTSAYVGGTSALAGGRGVLNVSSGTMTVTNALKVWNTAGSVVSLSGGTLNAGFVDLRDGTGGARGRLNWTNGTLNLTNSGWAMSVGSYMNDTIHTNFLGTLLLSATKSMSCTGDGWVGTADSNAIVLTQTGGSNVVGGYLAMANTGNSGTYNMQGGTLAARDMHVGANPAFTVSKNGFLNLSGGAVTVANTFKVWNRGATQVTFSGGTLTVGAIETDGNPARFNWTGGTLEFTGSSPTIGSGAPMGTALTLASGMTLRIRDNSALLRVLPTGTLTFTGGKLDLTDKKLISSTDAVGSVSGSTYTGVTGLIASGKGTSNTWDGSGIVTSQSSATGSSYTSIGIASAAQAKGVATTATAVWAGQTVTGSDTLVMYTYGGDANLDGQINIDDYGHIDTSVGIDLTGWFNGDFNYDGQINIDDYGIIDVNVGVQTLGEFSTAGDAVGIGASAAAVPEPVALAILPCATAGLLLRRRRGR